MTNEEKAEKWKEMQKETFERFAVEVLGAEESGTRPPCFGSGAPFEFCNVCHFQQFC